MAQTGGAGPAFLAACRDLVARSEGAGWQVTAERPIDYGRQYRLARGGVEAVLSCYHGKKGFRAVVGGKGKAELEAVLGTAGPAPDRERAPAVAGPPEDPFAVGLPRIGADESGKGDYFGPLTVAAWYVDEATLDALLGLGVTDSKQLDDRRIETLAGALDRLGRGAVRSLVPDVYNARYADSGNLNVLLAELHAACVGDLLTRAADEGWPPPRGIMLDQFARSAAKVTRTFALPRGVRLHQAPRAEADPAVAAASVLARAAFVAGLRDLSAEYGMRFPAGAGTPVLRAGRSFVASYGADDLSRVAKVHFATTRQIT